MKPAMPTGMRERELADEEQPDAERHQRDAAGHVELAREVGRRRSAGSAGASSARSASPSDEGQDDPHRLSCGRSSRAPAPLLCCERLQSARRIGRDRVEQRAQLRRRGAVEGKVGAARQPGDLAKRALGQRRPSPRGT